MEQKKLSEIIDYLLNKHHKYLRDILPVIKEDLTSAKGMSLNAEIKGTVDSISKIFQEIDMDVGQHLMKEENILFPTISDMEEALDSGNTDALMGCGAEGPINQMKSEHNILKESLAHLEKDVSDFSCLIKGTEIEDNESIKNLIKNTLEMNKDLLTHIQIEEEDLFPRAIALESKIGAG